MDVGVVDVVDVGVVDVVDVGVGEVADVGVGEVVDVGVGEVVDVGVGEVVDVGVVDVGVGEDFVVVNAGVLCSVLVDVIVSPVNGWLSFLIQLQFPLVLQLKGKYDLLFPVEPITIVHSSTDTF